MSGTASTILGTLQLPERFRDGVAPADDGPGRRTQEKSSVNPNLNNSPVKADTQAVRSKVSRPALVGRRCNRLGYVAAMRERQPRGQLAGRLLWGLAVEGHHRSGHARLPGQLSTPAVTDRRHVDLVQTPTYRFFEMVNDHLSGGPTDLDGNVRLGPDTRQSVRSAGDFTRSSRPIKRREARRHHPQGGLAPIPSRSRQRNFFVIRLPTRYSRAIHSFSTAVLREDRRIRAGAACRMRLAAK